MRKQTRRKVYNLVNPIQFAMVGAATLPRKTLNDLRLKELAALDAMTKGQGTVSDWAILVDCMNLCEVMGKNGIGPEVLPVCEKVQETLHKAALHYEKTKRMVLDGPGIQAIRDLLEYADLQQASIPRSDFEKMIQKTINITRTGQNVVRIQ